MLGIAGTKITDEGLKHLRELKNLNYLSINRTKVTDAAALDFQKRFPDCEIEHQAFRNLKKRKQKKDEDEE